MEKSDYEYEINEIPSTTWQNMRDSVALLASSTTSAEMKNELGRQLLQQISLFQNKNSFKINDEASGSPVDRTQDSIRELRHHVYGTEEKVRAITDKLVRIDGNNCTLNDRLAVVDDKLQRMENINCNFRKILKLENEFLRELSMADQKTIQHLQKKLQILRSKLETITKHSTCNGSPNCLALTAESGNDEINDIPFVPVDNLHLSLQPKSSIVRVSPIVIGIKELMARGFSKDNILELFRGIRNPEINN